MAGVLRRLVTEIVLKSADAVKGLKAYDRLWKATATSVEQSAAVVERAAERAGAALARMSQGAGAVRAAAGGAGARAGGGGGGGGRRPADPLAAATARAGRAEATRAGMAAGAASINDATAALGKFASASDRAKAAVKDLEAQVARNRKEMADLRAQALATGDADGTLAARMKGLAAATGQAEVQLQAARKTLRGFEGGLIDAVKKATMAKVTVEALGTAFGNMITGTITGGLGLIKRGLTGAAGAAIDFESNMADVKKVLPSTMDAKQVQGLEDGIKAVSREIGVMPEQVAALTASLAQSGIGGDELLKTAEDASKLAVAFGIGGEEAGQALAKLRTGLGLSRDDVNSLTGSINELSNGLAATAPEITDAVQRVGSVAKAANISAESTAALATAMIASGANAEVAATGTKNFIRALGSGAAATKKQREAFAALGLSAEETAGYLVKGGKEAEETIKDVVGRIGQLRQEDRLPVLIELFGSESIGAIGPLATNIDLLGKAFEIAGDKTAAAGSVQKEYETRSETTASAIEKLKANIGVLAIELGNALLPYIQKISDFLTSPEGQKWGADAVETAKNAVVGLASAVKSVAEFFGWLIDQVGSTGVAVGALGVAVAGLAGPFGIALGAGVAMGVGIAKAIDSVVNRAQHAQDALDRLQRKADEIRRKEQEAERADQVAESDEASAQTERARKADAAADAWYEREKKKRGGDKDLSLYRRSRAMREELLVGRYTPGSTFDQRLAAFEGGGASNEPAVVGLAGARAEADARKKRGGGSGSGVNLSKYSASERDELFKELAARKAAGAVLKPSEQALLRALSKDLDRAIPGKMSKMDQQLASLDPALAGVLTQGGETDNHGDLKVAGNALDRGVFARATGGSGGGSGGVGPGPNIVTTNIVTTLTVTQQIDARSTAAGADNLRTAGEQVAQRVGSVVFTGVEKVLAMKQSGARMVPGG